MTLVTVGWGGCEPLGRSAAPPGVLRSSHKPGPLYLKHNLIILSNFKRKASERSSLVLLALVLK